MAAFAAAVSVMFCGVPGLRLNDEGFAVTPDGNPEGVTLTFPENPLSAVLAITTVCPLAPVVNMRLVVDVLNVKSGWGLFSWLPQAPSESMNMQENPAGSSLHREVLHMILHYDIAKVL